MQWSKIKNIVILILLVVNALLLAQVGYREMESARYRRQARDEAALLLAQSGIRVDVASLPEDPGLLSMRCERDSGEEAVLAEALLGSSAEQPDGSFSGERGTVWFYSSGEFYAVFKPGAWQVETAPEATAYRVMELLEIRPEACQPEVLANLVFSCVLIYNSAPESMPFFFPAHLEETAELHVKFLVRYLASLRGGQESR